ncbi:MAG: alkaline phosphatase family protein [Akkermansiaceae bacterium]
MKPHKQLVLLWETASWVDIERLIKLGKLPNFQAFCSNGTAGRLTSVEPISAITGATSIAIGSPPCDHHIFSNLKANNGLVSEVLSSDWKPIWQTLTNYGDQCLTINWPLTHPATSNAAVISDRFSWNGHLRYLHCTPLDSLSSSVNEEFHQALNRSRIQHTEINDQLLCEFLGINLTELQQDKESQSKYQQIRLLIAQIYSIHAASLYMLEHQQWDVSFISYPGLLEASTLINHSALEAKHRDKIYTILDQLLGILLSKLPEEVTAHILSSYSVQSALTHAPQGTGIWAIQGSNLIEGRVIHGAHVLDITPTIMSLRGHAVQDFPHQPRTDLFSTIPSITTSPDTTNSHTAQPSHSHSHSLPWDHLLDNGRSCNILSHQKRFDPALVKQIQHNAQHGFFDSLLQQQRFSEACVAGEKMNTDYPNSPKSIINYGYCLLAEKNYPLLAQHLKKVQCLTVEFSDTVQIELKILTARLNLRTNNQNLVIPTLQTKHINHHATPYQHLKIAGVFRDLGEFKMAKIIYNKLISQNPQWIQPRLMLAVLLLKNREYPLAEKAAQEALKIDSTKERAQYTLAMARLRQGKKTLANEGIHSFINKTGGTRLIQRILKFTQL